jgi:hypothetical protein
MYRPRIVQGDLMLSQLAGAEKGRSQPIVRLHVARGLGDELSQDGDGLLRLTVANVPFGDL